MTTPTSTPGSAYELLQKPTLDLTDAEAEAIIVDLRRRRELFLRGQKDNPRREAKAKAVSPSKPTKAEQEANANALLAKLNLLGGV